MKQKVFDEKMRVVMRSPEGGPFRVLDLEIVPGIVYVDKDWLPGVRPMPDELWDMEAETICGLINEGECLTGDDEAPFQAIGISKTDDGMVDHAWKASRVPRDAPKPSLESLAVEPFGSGPYDEFLVEANARMNFIIGRGVEMRACPISDDLSVSLEEDRLRLRFLARGTTESTRHSMKDRLHGIANAHGVAIEFDDGAIDGDIFVMEATLSPAPRLAPA